MYFVQLLQNNNLNFIIYHSEISGKDRDRLSYSKHVRRSFST